MKINFNGIEFELPSEKDFFEFIEWAKQIQNKKDFLIVPEKQKIERKIRKRKRKNTYKRWTQHELKIALLYPPAKAAKMLCRSLQAVYKVRSRAEEMFKKHNVRKAKQATQAYKRWTKQDLEIVRLYPPEQAAAKLNRSVDAIYIKRNRLGIAKNYKKRGIVG